MQQTNQTDNKSLREKILNEPIPSLITKMAMPTTFSQIISVIYNTADTYFVAHLGKSAAAAVGVGFSLMSIIQAIGFGFGMGAGSLISRRLGAKDEQKASEYASSALAAAVTAAGVLAVIGLFNVEAMMKLLGSSESMLSYSCAYAKYIFFGCPIMCAALVLNIVLRAEGHAKYAMIGLTAGGLLNIVLDPIFIYKLNMGIAGAAAATSLSQLVSCAVLAVPFLMKKSVVCLSIKNISKVPSDYRLIITTGTPTIFRQGLASFSSALLNRRARVYGDAAVAAVTIANKIYLLIRNIVLGIGQGFQPVAGYNYGAGNKKRTRQAFTFACVLGSVICIISAAAISLNAKMLIGWFQSDSQVVSFGRTALYFACAAMPFMAYSTFVDQLYQCLGFSKTATLLASNRQGIMFIPSVLLLPMRFGLNGILLAQPLADILSFFVCIPFQIGFFKRVLAK